MSEYELLIKKLEQNDDFELNNADLLDIETVIYE
jgi:hypothetical protein